MKEKMVVTPRDRLLINHPTPQIVDAYREIRTNLLAKFGESRKKTILVASTNYRDKKTNAAINLAASVAALDREVLLADCDLRRPETVELLGLSGAGLSECLRGQTEFSPAALPSPIPHLSVLPAGKTTGNGTELFHDTAMARLLTRMRESYDYVILNAAPLSEAPDTLVLAEQCDGVVIVLKKLSARHPDVQDMLGKFLNLKVPVLGFIVTE